jgi:hypothetical protein
MPERGSSPGSSRDDLRVAPGEDADEQASSTSPKRPWKRPSIESGKLFESNSLACGKNGPMTEECFASPGQS